MLKLHHPGVARIDCVRCQLYSHDMETGDPMLWFSGPHDNRQSHFFDKVASPGYKPPCMTAVGCAKESPAKAHLYELSDRNLRVMALWKRVRATHGACLPAEADEICLENLAVVDDVMRQIEIKDIAKKTAVAISRER